jgi:hypothetical protein
MKLGNIKITFLLIDLVLLCGSIILSYILDPLKSTRQELERFYMQEFKSFSIDNIISIPYPSGRGNYKLFSSSIRQEYFPILLKHGDDASYDLFKVGTTIDKPANSLNLTLEKSEVRYHVNIRNPSDESTKGDFLFPAAFFGSILVLFLILPNAFFENLVNLMFNNKEWN